MRGVTGKRPRALRRFIVKAIGVPWALVNAGNNRAHVCELRPLHGARKNINNPRPLIGYACKTKTCRRAVTPKGHYSGAWTFRTGNGLGRRLTKAHKARASRSGPVSGPQQFHMNRAQRRTRLAGANDG